MLSCFEHTFVLTSFVWHSENTIETDHATGKGGSESPFWQTSILNQLVFQYRNNSSDIQRGFLFVQNRLLAHPSGGLVFMLWWTKLMALCSHLTFK